MKLVVHAVIRPSGSTPFMTRVRIPSSVLLIYRENIKEKKCEECGLEEWNGKKITLHLDHINGDNLDNRIKNLRILCPNCHSQTETYCIGTKKLNVKKIHKITKTTKTTKTTNHCKCGKEINKRSSMCEECFKKSIRKVKERPSKNDLIYELSTSNYTAVGKKYGVSDNTIRKWLK